MLDIKFIRENKEIMKEALRRRHSNFDLERLLGIDKRRRELLQEVERLRADQNKASEDMTKSTEQERSAALMAMRSLKGILKSKEEELAKLDNEFAVLMLDVPNVPDPSVPEGRSDAENVEIRHSGEVPQFSFTPKNYMELLSGLDLADLERGTKVSGFRGYFLKNEGVALSFAMWQLALNHLQQKGFIPFLTPALVKENIFVETGKLPHFRGDLYAVDDGLFLAPSAEIPMMGYHEGEMLSESELPKKYMAFSPCYRKEAGSYGKDTKGLYRLHEFMKVEQIILCKAEHQESLRWHEEITKYAEEIVQMLELPYHVVINCTGDLPFGFVKMYDIEVWIPSEKRYRESHSSSIVHDFQTRRLGIRYKSADGETHFAHSLNNTAIATPRILQSFLENHQQEDGSVKIPEALRRYTGFDSIRPRK